MHLAHREVMEAEGQVRGRIGIGLLLMRQGDVEADRRRTHVGRSPVCGLHDAGPAACGDDIVAGPASDGHRAAALRSDGAEGPGLLVPEGMPTWSVLPDARAAEHD